VATHTIEAVQIAKSQNRWDETVMAKKYTLMLIAFVAGLFLLASVSYYQEGKNWVAPLICAVVLLVLLGAVFAKRMNHE
jgi:hypothetical protein